MSDCGRCAESANHQSIARSEEVAFRASTF